MSTGPMFQAPIPGPFLPGTATAVSRGQEWVSLPKAALIGALLYGTYQMTRPKLPPHQVIGECQEKYCHQTLVDRPTTTLLKDQSGGAGLTVPPKGLTLRTPYEITKAYYKDEMLNSPGVKMIAPVLAGSKAGVVVGV